MTAPENITLLEPNEIFVFGSNRNGFHMGGAAKQALDKFGAIYEQGEGLQGQSYAIPTLRRDMKPYALTTIRRFVYDFLYFAEKHPDKTFLLTKVGCGIAGFDEADMKKMFVKVPKNVIKPEGW